MAKEFYYNKRMNFFANRKPGGRSGYVLVRDDSLLRPAGYTNRNGYYEGPSEKLVISHISYFHPW